MSDPVLFDCTGGPFTTSTAAAVLRAMIERSTEQSLFMKVPCSRVKRTISVLGGLLCVVECDNLPEDTLQLVAGDELRAVVFNMEDAPPVPPDAQSDTLDVTISVAMGDTLATLRRGDMRHALGGIPWRVRDDAAGATQTATESRATWHLLVLAARDDELITRAFADGEPWGAVDVVRKLREAEEHIRNMRGLLTDDDDWRVLSPLEALRALLRQKENEMAKLQREWDDLREELRVEEARHGIERPKP